MKNYQFKAIGITQKGIVLSQFVAVLLCICFIAGCGNSLTSDPEKQSELVDNSYNGEVVEECMDETIEQNCKVADNDNVEEQDNLAQCYEAEDKGVEENMEETIKQYRKAAENGDAEAQFQLALCYLNGLGVEKDAEQAENWCTMASRHGHAKARELMNLLNYLYIATEQEYLLYGLSNSDEVMFSIGQCYDVGHFLKQDIAEAVKWYRKAAEHGHLQAQYNLGICYANGDGVEKDMTEAVKWFREAAERGLAKAQYNLGYYYEIGEGVERDMTEAVKWYRKAADQGIAEAQANLGVCYLKGEGVYENKNEAKKWFLKAAAQGNIPAQKNLELLRYADMF